MRLDRFYPPLTGYQSRILSILFSVLCLLIKPPACQSIKILFVCLVKQAAYTFCRTFLCSVACISRMTHLGSLFCLLFVFSALPCACHPFSIGLLQQVTCVCLGTFLSYRSHVVQPNNRLDFVTGTSWG